MWKVNCLTAFELALCDVTWGLIPGSLRLGYLDTQFSNLLIYLGFLELSEKQTKQNKTKQNVFYLYLLDLPFFSFSFFFLSSRRPQPGRGPLSEDVLWAGSTVRANGGNRPRRVRVPGEVPALLRAGVRL